MTRFARHCSEYSLTTSKKSESPKLPALRADMKKACNRAFGKALREVRKEKSYTQETLAFECGLDRTYISLLERGINSPTLDTLVALSPCARHSAVRFAARIESKMRRKRL